MDHLKYELAKPLMVMRGKKGFLACGYINVETTNKTGEACAIVTGVNTFDDMLNAKVSNVSKAALDLGIQIGDTGRVALDKFE